MTRHRISRVHVTTRGAVASSVPFTVAAILGLAASGAAHGQEATPPSADSGPIEEIIVSGYRRSLEASIDIKRDAVGAVDAIVAEDIADFPDLNLAESIQRVPGVSIARDAGEGRQVTVRGLGPQFTRVRVNGMEAMSANGGTDAAGGTNRDRSFDFNTFASELFNSITIHKTSSAEVEEGSLGATVDLRAARPFDYDGFTFVSSLQGSYNDIEGSVDPRGAVLLSNRFFDGKVGALISAAYSERALLDEGASTVRWQTGGFTATGAGYPSTAPTLAELNAAYHPRLPRFDLYEHDQKRFGLTSSVQWAPTDATRLSVDWLYSRFRAERTEIFLEAPVFSAGGPAGIAAVRPRDALIDANGSLIYGVFDDVDIRSEARYDRLETQFNHVTLDLAQDLGDRFGVHALVGYSEANHRNPVQTTLLFDRNNIDGYVYDFRANNRLPLISYGDADVTNPSSWTLSQIRLRPQTSLNTFRNGSFEVSFDATDALTLKAGPQWKKFRFKTTSLVRSNGTRAGQEGVIPALAAATPIANYSKTVTLDSLDLPAGSASSWVVPDIEKAAALFDLYNPSVFRLGIENALNNNFTVEEEDTGGFIQADLDTELLGRRFRGSLGVRYVKTEMTSSGYSPSGNIPVLVTATNEYSDTLPSLNLSLDVTDDFILRLGASKVMARPNGSGQVGGLGILVPGSSTSIQGANKTLNTGNPDLDPYRAKAYDFSAEWYFGRGALLSAALFYKDIESYVQVVRQTGDFSTNPIGAPDSVALNACGPTVDPATCLAGWQFNVPRNSPGGNLKGAEISYQQPFSFLPAPWNGFGAVLNYTYVDSKIDYFVTAAGAQTIEADLIQLSKDAFNATLYFENDKFGVRVSAAYRGPYLTTVPGRQLVIPADADPKDDRYVEGTIETLNVDFSASWNLNENIQLTAEALNLTDEYQDQFVDSVANRLSYYHHQGRQYMLGARFKF